jgi:hypothetical protein
LTCPEQRPTALLVVLSLTVGIAIWLVTILLWGLQTMFGKGFLTPPDIVALGLPIYLLGVSLETGLSTWWRYALSLSCREVKLFGPCSATRKP